MPIAAGDYLLDIALGAAGLEVVLVSNLLFSVTGLAEGQTFVRAHIPIPIPAGSRVAARAQSTAAAATLQASIQLFEDNPVGTVQAVTYGAVTADSGGTGVDPGLAANTKGAWVEVSASLSSEMLAALLLIGNQNIGARANAFWLLDLGSGAAGAETVVVPDLTLRATGTQDLVKPQIAELPLGLAAGTRLAARAQCDITGASRLFDVSVIGFGP